MTGTIDEDRMLDNGATISNRLVDFIEVLSKELDLDHCAASILTGLNMTIGRVLDGIDPRNQFSDEIVQLSLDSMKKIYVLYNKLYKNYKSH